MKNMHTIVVLILVAGLLLAAVAGCGPKAPEEGDKPSITISSKTFAEALTLGNMTVLLLKDRGYNVVDEVGLGEVAVIRPALESGQIDMYWEYTGTGLFNVMQHSEVITDPAECYKTIREWDLENNDIVWLDYAPANNTFVLFISKEVKAEHGWSKLSDVAAYVGNAENSLKLAAPAEWMERADGLPNFQEHYGFAFKQSDLLTVELGLAYEAVGTGQAEIGVGDATEGRIAQFELVVLEDDKLFFPAYNPAPVVRKEILDAYPELADVMKELSSLLDLETLTLLNKKVAVDGQQPEQVAKEFLLEKGLISE